MTNSQLGKRFLIDHANTHCLEIFYDNDNTPHVNLCEVHHEHDGNTIQSLKALDMTDIYEQVWRYCNENC